MVFKHRPRPIDPLNSGFTRLKGEESSVGGIVVTIPPPDPPQ
jgi:hypothetical protein